MNFEGFLQVCVRLQRIIKNGFNLRNYNLKNILLKYAKSLARGDYEIATLNEWRCTDNEGTTEVDYDYSTEPCLIYSWLTDAIACSGNTEVKKLALAWDTVLAMQERGRRHMGRSIH